MSALLLVLLAACGPPPNTPVGDESAIVPSGTETAALDTGDLPVDETPWIRPHWRDTLRFPSPCSVTRHTADGEPVVLLQMTQSSEGEPTSIRHLEDGEVVLTHDLSWDRAARPTAWTLTTAGEAPVTWSWTYTGTSHLPVVARRTGALGKVVLRGRSAGERYTRVLREEDGARFRWEASWDDDGRPTAMQVGPQEQLTTWTATWEDDPLPAGITVQAPGVAAVVHTIRTTRNEVSGTLREGAGSETFWFEAVLDEGALVSWRDTVSTWHVTSVDGDPHLWASVWLTPQGETTSASTWRGPRPAPGLEQAPGFTWPWRDADVDHGGLPHDLPIVTAPPSPQAQLTERLRTQGDLAWTPSTRLRYDLAGNLTQEVHLDTTGGVVAVDVYDHACYSPFVEALPQRFEDEALP